MRRHGDSIAATSADTVTDRYNAATGRQLRNGMVRPIREEGPSMIKRIGCLLMLALCLTSLTACVIAPAPYGRVGGAWVPGHYNGWHWVPGHWA
jgi:hypothetical protein